MIIITKQEMVYKQKGNIKLSPMLTLLRKMIPKTQNFPQGVPYANQLVTLDTIRTYCSSINETNYVDQTTLADISVGVSTSMLNPRGVLTPANRIPGSHRKNVSHIPITKPKVAFSAQNDKKRLLRMEDKSMIDYKFKDKENIKQNFPKSSEKKNPRPIVKTRVRRGETDRSSYMDNTRNEEKENDSKWKNVPSPYRKYEYTESFTSTFQRDYNATLPSVQGFDFDQTTPQKITAPQTVRESYKETSHEFVNLSKLIENHKRKNPEVRFEAGQKDLPKRANTSIKKVKEPLTCSKDYAWAETCEFIRLEDLVSAEKKPKAQIQEFVTTPAHNVKNPFINSEEKCFSSNLKSQPSNTKRNLGNVWENTFASPQQDFKNFTWKSFKIEDVKEACSAKKEESKSEQKRTSTPEDKFVVKLGWHFEGEKIKEEEDCKSEDNAPYDSGDNEDHEQGQDLEESSIAKVSFAHSPEKSLEIREDFSKKSNVEDFSRDFFEDSEMPVKEDFFTNTEKSTGTRWFTAKKSARKNGYSSTKKKDDFVQSQSKLFESEIDTLPKGGNHDEVEIRLEETAQKKNSLIVLEDTEDEGEDFEDSLEKLVSEYVDLFEKGDKKSTLQTSRREKSFSPPFKHTLIVGDVENEEEKWLSKWIDNIDKSKIASVKGEDDNKNEVNESSHEIEVVYDPVWNCYYHPKTNAYYEMKE